MSVVFSPKKLRRNGVIVMCGSILMVVAVTVYYEMNSATPWTSYADSKIDPEASNWWRAMSDKWYKGRVNVHAFDDWCGGSTAELRRNLHYPLYPHVRTTVQKLALSLQRTNYGLRIFGYLHPFADGEFVFAISSGDNSELWLSTDDSPLNLNLVAYVGKSGTEWTAPGEFDKYASQTSRPVSIHIMSVMILCAMCRLKKKKDEFPLLIGDVDHVPQTAASHQNTKQSIAAVDMLRESTRDTLYNVSLINSNLLEGVLPDCTYKPSYTIKGYPLARYQGLQFVHMSYVYPNDYTRLTHMETESSCFYPKNIKT
ncbi:hypothetical protein F2P81_007062 [Scophthalmus maximus]|uniref:PA14 domain-containing protein n=1 Tax=Scophthalmus maximus TaxID=52904 RepID=A0A6A4TDB0_SCOMX|nr:hypothetical protein F2P81_007062 [Scophthalmus maximus]